MYKFLLPLIALAFLLGCTQTTTEPTTPSDTAMNDDTTADANGNVQAKDDTVAEVPQVDESDTGIAFDGVMLTGKHTVVMKTSMGDITLEIDADSAPKTATNFVVLGRSGYYDGLTFHRVIPDFMIQGGDPNGNGTGGESIYGAPFEDEQNDLQMVKGAIAMANRGPNTNGSQFFIVQAESAPWLTGRHTIFGNVTSGLDVVDAIANASRNEMDMPDEAITFTIEVAN